MRGIRLKWEAASYDAKWRTYRIGVFHCASSWFYAVVRREMIVLADNGYPTAEAAMIAAELAARAHFAGRSRAKRKPRR